MPVLLYLIALISTIVSSAAGITLLAACCAALTVGIFFRHELVQLLPSKSDFWRTEP